MYEKYNAVLRFHSAAPEHASENDVPFLQKKCEQLGLGRLDKNEKGIRWAWTNKYATTSAGRLWIQTPRLAVGAADSPPPFRRLQFMRSTVA